MIAQNIARVQRRVLFTLVAILCFQTGITQSSAVDVNFDKQVAPILAARCLECHSSAKPEAKLDLSRSETATKGGESGKAIVAKSIQKSLLWERVVSDEMPPKHPLSEKEKSILKEWIEEGAKWGTSPIDPFSFTTDERGGRDWWSLQPLNATKTPSLDELDKDADPSQAFVPSQWVKNEIDHFIVKQLRKVSLTPSPKAGPRALIRRLYFDLIGLPPTPEQIASFVAEPTQENYLKTVDQLLASKHYGERWARHWLDVVRFGESDGFERNNPRKNAWHYRDFVIKSINEDLPYDEFVRQQLIGDRLKGGIQGAAATGFWVAGVHNTVVGGSDRMKKLARQDELEEVLATVGQTFVGLTINCARCHDHKFDPISQKEFYQMASAISGLGYGEKTEVSSSNKLVFDQAERQIEQLQKELFQINQTARSAILADRAKGKFENPKPPIPTAQWNFDGDFSDAIGNLDADKAAGNPLTANGALILDGKSFLRTPVLKSNVKAKTLIASVQLDDLNQRGGGAISIQTPDSILFDAIVFGEQESKKWMAGSNVFARTLSFKGPAELEALKRPVHMALVYKTDGTIIGYRDGVAYGTSIRKSGLQNYESGKAQFLFGMRHGNVDNGFLRGKIHWAAFYDRALEPDEIAASAGDGAKYVSEEQIVKFLSAEVVKKRQQLKTKIAEATNRRDQAKGRAQKIYTLTPGGGAKTHVLLRGDPDNVGELVSPGAIKAVRGVNANFQLKPESPESARREKLAQWITSSNNPLFSRVIVNRIWHYHFGTGIVDTPNDFGFNGGRPSHPELLEWLSSRFKSGGYRMKSLHRLIVTSATYQQAGYVSKSIESAKDSANRRNQPIDPREVDASNRLLWKMTPRRLEAESIRDAMLFVAGKLNDQIGGPSFEDVSITSNNGTVYYEPIAVDGDAWNRRTIYRFNPRGGRSALLDTFDCPDPASTAPRRAVTTTPLQALSLLNNSFVLQMSEHFAKRIEQEAGDQIADQVKTAWRLAVGRMPSDSESKLSQKFVKEHGLEALARALFNSNEFVAIE